MLTANKRLLPHTNSSLSSISPPPFFCFFSLIPAKCLANAHQSCAPMHANDGTSVSVLFLALPNRQQAAGHFQPTPRQEGNNEWWNNGLSLFVNPTWCAKVKKKEKNPTATRSTISSQHKAALQAVFSIATGWIWPNKRETERKFYPVPADKRVLFQQLVRFLLEKCENLDWLIETRFFFSFPNSLFFFPFFFLALCLRPILDARLERQATKRILKIN